jgi:Fic family protein
VDTPWISFNVALKDMDPRFWMLLGEARSKCDHLTRVPTPPTVAQELHRVALTKGAHATTSIEGNTLTEDEVAALIERTTATPEDDYQVQEVRNVVDAYNSVIQRLSTGERPALTPELICEFNRLVLRDLETPSEVVPGSFRQHSVAVGPYRAPDAGDCEGLLHQMCEWLNGPSFSGDGAMRVPVAIIRASLAHLYLAWIHPFGDGNGRTARLCEFLVLMTSGVPTSAAHLISNHCNNTRPEYYRQLQYASKSGGDVTQFRRLDGGIMSSFRGACDEEFLRYCAEGFVLGLADQLRWLYDRQLVLTWREYVAKHVSGRDPDVRSRRAMVAEQLLVHPAASKASIPRLSPELAAIYAVNGPKTLTRDLSELVACGLISVDGEEYRANREILSSLMPLTVQRSEP